MMQVAFTPASLRDLAAIGDFIALDNRRRAKSFVVELRMACRSLASDGRRYPILIAVSGIRRMPFGNYLVLYRLVNNSVQIVRVIHSARDIGALPFEG